MPRAIVTPELTELLRSLRVANKISSKDLAAHISKSPAYISKLESGALKTLDSDELLKIIKFITNKENLSQDLVTEIYNRLSFKYSKAEIKEQLWFANFESVICSIPVPPELIDDLNQRLTLSGMTRESLHIRINSNDSLPDSEINDSSIPYNQWYISKNTDQNTKSIKIKLSLSSLSDILDKKAELVPYVFILSIAYYLLKNERFSDQKNISISERKQLTNDASSLLSKYNYFTASEKSAALSQKNSAEEINAILNSFDKDNVDLINDILSALSYASNRNIKTANEMLSAFRDNLRWDLGFTLRLMSLDFKSMEKTSVANKKELLMEINQLIEKYAKLTPEQNIEEY